MKKLVLFSLIFSLFAISASAQRGPERIKRAQVNKAYVHGHLTRAEKAKLHRNDRQYSRAKRLALRDGRLTMSERRQLQKMRKHDRRQTFRYKHNGRKRVI
jgi:hypothetical protein